MISVNMATYHDRFHVLGEVLTPLISYDFIDKIRVYINPPIGPDALPRQLGGEKISYKMGEKNIKAHGKFHFLNEASADEIYFTCDDDFIYSKEHFLGSIRKLNDYPGSIICTHGHKILKQKVEGYVSFGRKSDYYKRYGILKRQRRDVQLEIGGTGTMCFRAGTMQGYQLANECYDVIDPYVALHCQENDIKILCRKHKPTCKHLRWKAKEQITQGSRNYDREIEIVRQLRIV